MKRTGLMAVALAAVMAVGCGGDRDEVNTENPNATVGTGGEIGDNPEVTAGARGDANDVQAFVRDVTMANAAEIELGRLAAERGQNAEVKQYGQMMVDDHTRAGAELKAAIAGHNIQVHEQMDEEHQELAQRLRGLSGMEFDREYMNAMVDGHEDVKDKLEGRANEARDNDNAAGAEMAVNQWAAKTLPAVEKHRERAEQIRERLNDRRNQTN